MLLATRPVNFRRGTGSLAAMVKSVLRQERFCRSSSCFARKCAHWVKIRVYDSGADLEPAGRRYFKCLAISDGVMGLQLSLRMRHNLPRSNRRVAEWGNLFGHPVVAIAPLNRLLHHVVVIHIEEASSPTGTPDQIPENLRLVPVAS